ncbi:hypothetical protein NAL32_19530 [Chryseobacterium sp. Ch-15]|uniref:Uncharacterized protein n=1 Tax=Chryseobacterium muglaense TaxID=2893752 RepID=A0A9Q3UVZ7_9FLAO|nr:hypothetical protein [Chryseobacterium muglaense]MBD3906834.1 hypothetical protein [Chryseobacterium muglaense]MCC9034486.1 hypothetical protein [Chryseobacterium muglaense]MCM2556587.1 hypothetical protein [Chryseobacterium muglaense]
MKIETIEGFTTEGVLIIANITKCKEYYNNNEFNYNYPNGLAELLTKGIIHIITTDEDVELVDFTFDKEDIDLDTWKHQESYNYLNVEIEDEIRAISHASFTQMCDNHKGDFEAQINNSINIRNILNPNKPIDKEKMLEYDFPLLAIPSGYWKVNVYTSTEENVSNCAEFLFHLEKMDIVDIDKITLQPIEYYG